MNPFVEILVLLAVGAIIADLVSEAAAVNGLMTKAQAVWSWAINNAFGNATQSSTSTPGTTGITGQQPSSGTQLA